MEQLSILKSLTVVFIASIVFFIYVITAGLTNSSTRSEETAPVLVEEKVETSPSEVVKNYYREYADCITKQADFDIFADNGEECKEDTRDYITPEFINNIKAHEKTTENPILCTRFDPKEVVIENSTNQETTAQISVTLLYGSLDRRTNVILQKNEGHWLIDDIICVSGVQ